MKSTELQTQFYKENGIEAFNSQGEPDIEYVQWIEDKLALQQVDISGRIEQLKAFSYWLYNNWFDYSDRDSDDAVDDYIKII